MQYVLNNLERFCSFANASDDFIKVSTSKVVFICSNQNYKSVIFRLQCMRFIIKDYNFCRLLN